MTVGNASRVVTSNSAFYFVCYRLSLMGWNVEPSGSSPMGRTLRISKRGVAPLTIKVKGVNGRLAAGFGTGTLLMPYDFVVVSDVSAAVGDHSPRIYVLSTAEAATLVNVNEKDGQRSFWLEIRDYAQPAHENAWSKIDSTVVV
jgi:hypothetical protein